MKRAQKKRNEKSSEKREMKRAQKKEKWKELKKREGKSSQKQSAEKQNEIKSAQNEANDTELFLATILGFSA
jgi:hypothetical protein